MGVSPRIAPGIAGAASGCRSRADRSGCERETGQSRARHGHPGPHPTLNLPRILGVELDTATFIRMAASAEILFGLLVIAGVTPRVVALSFPSKRGGFLCCSGPGSGGKLVVDR